MHNFFKTSWSEHLKYKFHLIYLKVVYCYLHITAISRALIHLFRICRLGTVKHSNRWRHNTFPMQGTSRCRHHQREFYAPVGQSWVWLLALMRAIQSGTCAPDCKTALRDVNYSLWQKEQIGIHYWGRRILSKGITNGIEAFINPKPRALLWKWLIALSTSVTSCLHDDFAFYICYYKTVEYISKFTKGTTLNMGYIAKWISQSIMPY